MSALEPENIPVAPAAKNYLETIARYGMLEGEIGDRVVDRDVGTVLNALHHVLAGGSVSVSVDTPGAEAVVDELDRVLQGAVVETNQLGPGNPGMFD